VADYTGIYPKNLNIATYSIVFKGIIVIWRQWRISRSVGTASLRTRAGNAIDLLYDAAVSSHTILISAFFQSHAAVRSA
jgi:hypothetical protein